MSVKSHISQAWDEPKLKNSSFLKLINMDKPVVDTVVLRVMSFAHPQGIEILLEAINVSCGRFPTEVYNRNEAATARSTGCFNQGYGKC